MVALAMTEARSSVGLARRSAVSAMKYSKKPSSTAILLLRIAGAIELVVVAAEQLPGELQHSSGSPLPAGREWRE
jgi:hypothetical protein